MTQREWRGKGDKIIERLLKATPDEDTGYANLLLEAIFEGFPVGEIKVLLDSENDRAAAEGAWILAECGHTAREFTPWVPALVAHKCFRVRFWMPEFVLLAATDQDGPIMCEALRLLDDADDRVRWNAINQFSKIAAPVWLAARRAAESAPSLCQLGEAAREADMTEPSQIERALRSADRMTRSAAAIAMIRNLPADEAMRAFAATSSDRVIRGAGLGEWQE